MRKISKIPLKAFIILHLNCLGVVTMAQQNIFELQIAPKINLGFPLK